MNIGVIGSGAISEIYLKNLTENHPNVRVLALASKHPENAQKRARQFGLRACTVEELLADPEIEMIVNLTPVGVHYGIIRRCLEAGKHVYTEKTITDHYETARELLALAEKKGLYLGSAPDTFLGSALQNARAAIDSGMLGEIHSFAISSNRNNDVLLSMFAFLREPGAGVLLDYGVYYLTALVSLLGPVARVAGIVGAPYKTHRNILPGPDYGKLMDTPNESQVSAIVRLRNGITGTVHMDNDCQFPDEAFFAIYGTKGILRIYDDPSHSIVVKLADGQEQVYDVEQIQTNDNQTKSGVIDLWVDCLKNNRAPEISGESALCAMRAVFASIASSQTGKAVEIEANK